MPYQTLIIGLGTSGAEIASKVLERVVTKFEDAGKPVPWVRAIAIDTALLDPKLFVGKRGKVLNVDLSNQEKSRIAQRPGDFASIDLELWTDPQIRQNITQANLGSSLRMVGRIKVLHPDSFQAIHDAVTGELTSLQQLPFQTALERVYGAEQTNAMQANQAIRNNIQVWVCGSLTGGTCSGSFLDIGFYLCALRGEDVGFLEQRRPALFPDIEVGAFLTLPHQAVERQFIRGNAYGGLQELHHFHRPGSRYRAKVWLPNVFPQNPLPNGLVPPNLRLRKRPFQPTFVVVPPNDGLEEIQLMEDGIAELIFEGATGVAGQVALAKLVDPTVQHQGRSSEGRFMDFATMGISTIEFPANAILQRCAHRLVADTLTPWLNQSIPSDEQGKRDAEALGISMKAVVASLLRPGDGQSSAHQIIEAEIKAIREAARRADESAILAARNRIEQRLKYEAIDGSVPRGDFLDRMKANKGTVQEELFAGLLREVKLRLKDVGKGPNAALGLIRASRKPGQELAVNKPGQESANNREARRRKLHASTQTADQTRSEALDAIKECNGFLLRYSGWGKLAVNDFAKSIEAAERQYWDARLELACLNEVGDVFDAFEINAKRLEDRISDPTHGLIAYATRVLTRCNEVAGQASFPAVRGLLLADETTVESRYRTGLMQASNRPGNSAGALAEEQRKLLESWNLPLEALDEAANKSRFDKPDGAKGAPELGEADVDNLLLFARQPFQFLKSISVIDELVAHGDVGATLGDVLARAQPPQVVAGGYNPIQEEFVFYCDGGSSPANLQQVENWIQGNVDGSRIAKTSDPTKIVFLRTMANFPLEALETVRGLMPFFESDNLSRTDIEFHRLDGQPLCNDLNECQGLFFLARACDLAGQAGYAPNADGMQAMEYELRTQTPFRIRSNVAESIGLRISRKPDVKNELRARLGDLVAREGENHVKNRLSQYLESSRDLARETADRLAPGDLDRDLDHTYVDVRFVLSMAESAAQVFSPPLAAAIRELRANQYTSRPEDYMVQDALRYKEITTFDAPAGFQGCYLCPSCKTQIGDHTLAAEALPETCPSCGYRLWSRDEVG